MLKTIEQPRVLAIGTPLTLRRLCSKIEPGRFKVTACQNPAEALGRLFGEEFDIVVVDSLAPQTQSICLEASAPGLAPVALLVGEKPADWLNLRHAAVDGYLIDRGSRAEFSARLHALSRRRALPAG